MASSSTSKGEGRPGGRNLPKAPNERREEIVAVAYGLYREKGIARSTVKEITDRVGVTRTLFYHYFSGKEDLTSAVLDRYIDDFVESLRHWNEGRREGQIEHALHSLVKLLRMGLFEDDPFHVALASRENAALYQEFVCGVADRTAAYIMETTVRDYAALHEVRIEHVHETFCMLITGVIGYLRNHPEVDDAVIADVIAQTLHMDRP